MTNKKIASCVFLERKRETGVQLEPAVFGHINEQTNRSGGRNDDPPLQLSCKSHQRRTSAESINLISGNASS